VKFTWKHSWSLGFCMLLQFFISCGGNGGGGGSSPTEPPNPSASIQGTWIGTATSVSASGTCLARDFRPLTVPAKWVIQQSGATFTGQQTLNNVITCPFRGTLSGSSVSFFPEAGGSTFCSMQTIVCSSEPGRVLRMELRTDRSVQVGAVAGDRISASGSSTWRITVAQTGQIVGDYEVRGTQELRKQ
jgi:hypothetical protein